LADNSSATNAATLRSLEHIATGLERLSKISGDVVVQDSKHIAAKEKNRVGAVQVSPTAADARNAARFRNTKLQQPFDETDTPDEELAAADDALVDDYLEDIIDKALGI